MIFLALPMTKLIFPRPGPGCSMLCFVRRFFCVSGPVFGGFERAMLIPIFSM